jgi:Tfp pilus assembly protein PilO
MINNMRKMIEPGMLKMIGVYVIIILALVRFIVYPLHNSVAKEKIIFSEIHETYQLKEHYLERHTSDKQRPVKTRIDKDAVAPYLYEKGMTFPSIQADVIENIMKLAEKKSLTVQNFEMLEPVGGKNISEVPILIRLSGKPMDMLDAVKSIVSEGKVVQIKSLEMAKSNPDFLLALTINAFRIEK